MLATLQHILATLGFHTDIASLLVLFGLVFTRLVLAIGLTPFFGGRSISGRIKVGLAAVVSILLFPRIAPSQVGQMTTLLVMFLLIKEAVIGATVGFIFFE